jgi:hypothetical protein
VNTKKRLIGLLILAVLLVVLLSAARMVDRCPMDEHWNGWMCVPGCVTCPRGFYNEGQWCLPYKFFYLPVVGNL